MGCFLLLSCAALLQISLAMNSTQPMNSSSDDSCKSYCQRITHPWKMKCIWNACSGCADCPLALPPPPPGAYPPAHPSIPPRKAHPAYPPFLPPWPTRPPLPPHKGLVSSCYAKSGKASLDCIRNAEARSSLSWVEEVEETVEKMEETVEKELAVLGTAVEEDLESLSPEIVALISIGAAIGTCCACLMCLYWLTTSSRLTSIRKELNAQQEVRNARKQTEGLPLVQVARVMKQTDESPRSDGDGIQLHRKDGGQAQDMSASEVSSTH